VRRSRWDTKFTEPIPLPKGKPLATLRDAANYITKLPKKESSLPEWQAATEALLLVVENNGLSSRIRPRRSQSLGWGHDEKSR
jgi:hypothetical protein